MLDNIIFAVGIQGGKNLREVMPDIKLFFTSYVLTEDKIQEAVQLKINNNPWSAVVFNSVDETTKDLVDKVHQAGLAYVSWISDLTFKDKPDEIMNVVNMGIDGLCADGVNLQNTIDDYYFSKW